MRKKLIIPFFIVGFTCLLFFYEANIIEIKNLISMFLYVFVPALFPFILLSNIVLNSGIIQDKKIKPIVKKIILFFLIIVGGASIIGTFSKKIGITKQKNQELTQSFASSSFPFVFFLLQKELNKITALFIFLLLTSINIFNYLLISKSKLEITDSNELNIGNYIFVALEDTLKAMLNIFLTIIPFTIIQTIINMYLLSPFNHIATSLLEFSSGTYYLMNSTYIYKIPLTLFFVSFQSLTVFFQIKMENEAIKISPLIINRLLISIVFVLLVSCFF